MKKSYFSFIRPLQLLSDVFLINFIIYFIFDQQYLRISFLSYISFFWVFTTFLTGYYKVYRYTKVLRVFTLLVKQFLVFILGYFAYFGYVGAEGFTYYKLLILLLLALSIIKFIWFIVLNRYRSLGNNNKNIIVIGNDQSAKNIIKLFKSKSNLGYRFLGFFDNKKYSSTEYLGDFKKSFDYILNNEVDEVYCSLNALNKDQIKMINKFCIDNNIVLKLIPEANELYGKNQTIEFYDDTLLVLNIEKLPFDFSENFIIKRIFDILFSILVCLLVLSWIIPILWVLVKLESKGPLIFKQKREGLNGEHFICYKFRSMRINDLADKIHATKNDSRVTKIGAFLRRTSIDELPQFFNVLLGDMSVVGPRPHIESLSLEYQKVVDDYLKRHIVKPGITGLAQISGYRGEVKKSSDIKNRVRLDIFYIENWSFFLDIKIILKTIFNVFLKEEKAY